MPGEDIPGLETVIAAAAALGIDISGTVARARMLMQPNAPAVRAGGDQLGTVAGAVHPADLDNAGKGVLASGWSGQAADAFAPHHAGMVAAATDIGTAAGDLSTYLGEVAKSIEEVQNVVVRATGAAAVQLGIGS